MAQANPTSRPRNDPFAHVKSSATGCQVRATQVCASSKADLSTSTVATTANRQGRLAMNAEQAMVVIEQAVKAKIRDYLIRKYVGFDAIYRPKSMEHMPVRMAVCLNDIVVMGKTMSIGTTGPKLHKVMMRLVERGDIDSRDLRYFVPLPLICEWFDDVTLSLERQGLPYYDDKVGMEQARLKANELREKRRAMWRT
ncbi:hypothetical protein 20Sep420_00063 [Pseudomonas phage 20Sep420]|nr:hypothetical protein 20Sep420_00063 [Pseudomonas phage 20Sep420]